MTQRLKRRSAFWASVLGVLIVAGMAQPRAVALGTSGQYCNPVYGWYVSGTSTTTYASTAGPGGGSCGSPGVKAYWQYYPGGITYSSGWVWSCYTCYSSVYRHSSIVGGGHNTGVAAFGAFPFFT